MIQPDGAGSRVTERWRAIAITDFERKQLKRLQEELRERHREANAPAVKSTSNPNHVYSKERT